MTSNQKIKFKDSSLTARFVTTFVSADDLLEKCDSTRFVTEVANLMDTNRSNTKEVIDQIRKITNQEQFKHLQTNIRVKVIHNFDNVDSQFGKRALIVVSDVINSRSPKSSQFAAVFLD